MTVSLDKPLVLSQAPARTPAAGGLALPWLIALVLVVPLSLLLPVPGQPVFLAAFLGAVGSMIVFARHWLITLLPVLALLGLHFLPFQAMGVNVFGFRLLIMLLALFSTPLTTRGDWWFNPVARAGVMFMVFWLLWGGASLFWSAEPGPGLNDVITIVFGLGLLLVLLSLGAHKATRLDKLRFGWLLALVAAAASAFLEIATGRRLPGDPFMRGFAKVPVSFDSGTGGVFDNSGMFGGFLLLTVPFVLWSFERAKGPAKLVHLGLLLMVGALVLYSASRLALAGMVVQLVFYALLVHRRWYMPLLVAVGGLAAVLYGSLLVESDLKVAQKLEKAQGGDRSIEQRIALTLNGLWMTYETAGRGVGAAGFEDRIVGELPVKLPIEPGKAWNPHNFWVEVMSEYGVLTFGAMIALLAWIGRLGWQARHSRGDPERRSVGGALLVGLVGYLFFGVAGGSPIPQSTHWMYLTSLVVMAAFLCDRPATRRAERMPEPADPPLMRSRSDG